MLFHLFHHVEAHHESKYFWCQLLLLFKRFVHDIIALFTDEYSSQLFLTTYNISFALITYTSLTIFHNNAVSLLT